MFRKITIRTNILTNIAVVVALVAGSLLWMQWHFSQQMAHEATQNDFKSVAKGIARHLQDRDDLAKMVISEMEYIVAKHLENEEKQASVLHKFTHTMSHLPKLYALSLGYPNGDLFEVVNMHDSERLYTIYKAPSNTRWLLIRVYDGSEGRTKRFTFLDRNFKTVSTRDEPTDYDATTRPWYLQAGKSEKAVRSLPYRFSNLGERGITYSIAVRQSETVLAADITLSDLSDILKEQLFAPTAKIVMFDRSGAVIASSDRGKKVDSAMITAVERNNLDGVFTSKSESGDRFMMVTPLSKELGEETYLGFSVETRTMLAPYIEKIYHAFGVALLALILSIPLVLFTTSRIVRPIRALMRENDKIKARRYEEVKPVKTNIIELIQLSDSLISMSRSIQAYEKSLKEMMESFIRLIADAIDAKSPYTGGHCKRVPVIAEMLAKAASESEEGEFKNFRFQSEEELKAFEMGAWLHDCGKITTPEYVVDKATKLETIYNRIHEIRTRFEVIWRDIEILYYERLLKGEEKEKLDRWKAEEHRTLIEEFNFIAECNLGGEFMSDEKKHRIETIAKRTWLRHFDDRLGLSDIEQMRYNRADTPLPVREPLLSDRPEHIVERYGFNEEDYRKKGFKLHVPKHLYNQGEIYNLCIEKGTLTEEERFKIEEHVIMTIKMLEQLPYPPDMEKIPEYAGTHHETMDGTGYPRRLPKEKLSIPARIMAIADIFEALTASDRPYKKMKTLSESLQIMSYMVKEGHLDAEVFALFLKSGIYRIYAEKYLKPEQIDKVDIDALLTNSQ